MILCPSGKLIAIIISPDLRNRLHLVFFTVTAVDEEQQRPRWWMRASSTPRSVDHSGTDLDDLIAEVSSLYS